MVRPERPEDHGAVRRVHLAAFAGIEEADIVERLRKDAEAYVPDLSLVALEDDEVVGHCILSNGILPGAKIAMLGPIGLLPHCQRRGMGSALVTSAIKAARDAGYDAIVLIGHPSYYPRFGFVPASRLGLSVAYDVTDEAAMALKLTASDLPARGMVEYPEAFG